MEKKRKKYSKLLKVLLIIPIFVILSLSIMFFSVYFSAKLDKNALISQKANVELLDAQNEVIPNEKMFRYIPYENISKNVIDAFVALEDKRFFSHHGVDYYRMAGALVKDLKSGSLKEGGSTITQQLAKNTQLSNEKTLRRKIKELRLAGLIEKNYSKEQILEMYLNAIYFGSGIYGIDSAAKNYFGKSASELSASEGATLAGIVKNPSKYSPKTHPDNAVERRNLVLSLMNKQGYLDSSAYSQALSTCYSYPQNAFDNVICAAYYNNVLNEASELLNLSEKQLICSEYRIYTYYDEEKQKVLHDSAKNSEYDSINIYGIEADKSAILCDNATGGIVACYGLPDTDLFSFRRQPASTIKPIIVYAPAFEYGLISPSTPLLDEKIDINGYSPKNYGGNYSGWITAETALKKSVNTVAVKIYEDLGEDKAKSFASNCGLKLSEKDGAAAALGGLTDGLTMPELTEAYMCLANGGIRRKNTFVRKIVDKNGKILYENKEIATRVMSDSAAYLTTNVLCEATKSGTSSKLNGFSYEIAAKTGTAQNVRCGELNKDAWSVSYTTQNTLAVWYGDVKNTDKSGISTTGSAYPTLLARKIYSLLPPPAESKFTIPDSVFSVEIDKFAKENDHILYLCNSFTPTDYREKVIVSAKCCPDKQSPYFDVNNVYFSVKTNATERTVEISSSEPFDYVLEEYDLLNDTKKEFFISENGVFALPYETQKAVYSYKLLVRYKGEPLGYASIKDSYFTPYDYKL